MSEINSSYQTKSIGNKMQNAVVCMYQTEWQVSANLDFFTALLLQALGYAQNPLAV